MEEDYTLYVYTETGSVYKYQSDTSEVGRVEGEGEPTERVANWKRVVNVSEPKVGEPWLILWKYEDGVAKTTLTSLVVKWEKTS